MPLTVDEVGPPRVVLAPGAEARVSSLLEELGARRVLVVCTGRHRAGAERVSQALGSRCVGTWSGALPQVPAACAAQLVRRVQETGADWLLAHGGGTAVGAAKAAALETAVRLAAVPTTYAGSEMTPIYGITRDGVKQTGRDPRVQPRLVVYDPELLRPLRAPLRRTSLLNALAHSVDGLFDDQAAGSVHDQAQASVEAILAGLRGLERDDQDLGALSQALYGAHLAGLVLAAARMALQHKLAHVLGGSFGTPHAATHAALLPYTMAFNLAAAPRAAARLRRAFGQRDPAAALHELCAQLGVSTRLSDLGLELDQVPHVVELALARRYANPRPLIAADLERLLSEAVLGRPPDTASWSTPSWSTPSWSTP